MNNFESDERQVVGSGSLVFAEVLFLRRMLKISLTENKSNEEAFKKQG